MKLLLRFAFLFFFLPGTIVCGQYSLNTSLVIPSGDYAYLLKPAPCFELGFKTGDIDSHYTFTLSLGYCKMHPTQDTFRTYAVGGNPFALLPGYEVIHSYEVLPIGMSNEYVILGKKKLSPFVGLDLYFYVISIAEDDYAETLVQSSTTGDIYWSLAILPRIGCQYKINDKFLLSGGLGRSMSFTGTAPTHASWNPFITIAYYPD